MRRVTELMALIVICGPTALVGCGGTDGLELDDATRARLEQAAAAAPDGVANGKALFAENCSVCHGQAADGTDLGPPLAHMIYRPNHHADVAFTIAVRIGVRAHHWRFGDMGPLPHVTDDMTREITTYVRWLQREVGIE